MDKEYYPEAKEILAKIEKFSPVNQQIIYKKFRLAIADKNYEEAFHFLNQGYKEYPDFYQFVQTFFTYIKDGTKDINRAIDILEDYLDGNYNIDAADKLVECYFKIGKFEKGIKWIEQLIDNNPVSIGEVDELADVYYNMRQYEKAIEYYQTASKIAPFVGKYYGETGNCYKELNDNFEAKNYYNKCLTYQPTNYSIRENLRKLYNQKLVFDFFEKPDFYKLFKEAPKVDEYPDDNSIILYDEVQRVVYKSGGSEEKHFLLVKTFNSAGIDNWKEYYVPVYSGQDYLIEYAEVLKKDGNRLKAELKNNHIVFPSLSDGDGILIIYKIQNYNYGKLSKHFWDEQFFKSFVPKTTVKYSLLIEPGIDFRYKVLNSDLKPIVKDLVEFKLYTWEAKNQQSIKHEKNMPQLNDVGEVLHISSLSDWDFVSKWYSDLSRTKAKADFEVKETIKTLFASKENLSTLDKVKEIYNYIVKNIRYSFVAFRQSGMIPQKASKVLSTKIGDCKDVSTLFTAMCSEIGVTSHLVLVSTRNNGKFVMPLPSIEFNHCIAKVIIEGYDYYVELTSDNNPFGAIGKSLDNAFILEIDDNPQVKMDATYLLPGAKSRNIIFRQSVIKFDDTKMLVEKNTIKTGSTAAGMRQSYRDIGKDSREKKMQEAITKDFPGIKLTGLKFDDNLKTTSDTVSYRIDYTVPNVFSQVSNLKIFRLPWSDGIEPLEFLSSSERKYPINFFEYNYEDEETEYLEITIPEQYKIAELPEDISYSCSIADYSLNYEQKDSKLFMRRSLIYKGDYVPLREYGDIKKFFEQVASADAKQLALE
ncbi:MAG: hypothetical protein HW421_2301 [Ignavibacteria bacterium]|nr:hypothetical protein [Ignavibacteria bacterium]